MKNKANRSINVFIITVILILSIIFIYVGNKLCEFQYQVDSGEHFATAKVLSIKEVNDNADDFFESTVITFVAKVNSGIHKYESIEMTQEISEYLIPVPKEVKPGDSIIVMYTQLNEVETEWVYAMHNRIPWLIGLAVIFLALIILIGRKKGIATIVSLIFTIGAIFLVYIPAILTGRNIYISTIIISLFIILMSFPLISGINKKTLCAIIGNIGGVVLAGVLAFIVNNILNITGFVDESSTFLSMLGGNVSLDLRAVVWGGILIGSLGAIMDVSMSISSAMSEISVEMRDKSFYKMVKSGMNIGKDVIGTMTNTLILAYVGSSLAVILLFTAYKRNLLMLFNLELVSVEIIQAIVGSIGILLTVPATVLISAWMFNKKSVTEEQPAQVK